MNDVEIEKRVLKALLDGHKYIQFIIEHVTKGHGGDRDLRGRIDATVFRLAKEGRILGNPQDGWRLR